MIDSIRTLALDLPNLNQTCGNNPELCEQQQDIETTGSNVVGVLAWTIGGISVVMIIVGAIYLITSNGEPDKVKKGKQTIFGACIGLVVAILTAFILNTVIGVAEGETPTP